MPAKTSHFKATKLAAVVLPETYIEAIPDSSLIGSPFVRSEPTFIERRDAFLHTLKSKTGKSKYRRYSSSPIRYAGGKSLAVGLIIEHFPEIERLVAPFFGGGSVEIACANRLGVEVIGYDIFDLLVNYWQVQINNQEDLYQLLAGFEPTKAYYYALKQELKDHWTHQKVIPCTTKLAAYYYYNHNTSYRPGFLGWPSSVYMDEKRYRRLIDKVKHFDGNNISVHHGSFENVIPNHSGDFLYLDPPYYLDGDSKVFKGIYPQRNFPIHHNTFNHALLRDLLKAHSGSFALSYNDCSTIREWYKEFDIIDLRWQYTMGQGEKRIGKNRSQSAASHVKKSHEVLILKR